MCEQLSDMTIEEYFKQVNEGNASLPDESNYSKEIQEQLQRAQSIDFNAAALHVMSNMGAYNPSSAFEKKYNEKEFCKL